ncbi:protein NEGATIVE GRAVITROPIC RESPONSE OF ROOTS [Andrographis paniculata]|uniref:protein NEGATIVE GRAVITROPIC RESPONSE OF ROOTS n=1 Tax=Andrographis paniculata TaxID=175694 RepID=UPI0021E88068|nr:protein NEGATIVE GRAVITROPIC RESPONSE OF ROOTS [Andrographis paniculata]
MKFFSWMQSKLNAGGGQGQGNKTRPNVVAGASSVAAGKEPASDWRRGLLTIGTLGNTNLRNGDDDHDRDKQEIQVYENPVAEISQEEQGTSPDFSEFTAEEVNSLQKELKRLLNRKPAAAAAIPSKAEEPIADLPLDRFLNCPSSLEVDRNASNRFSTYSDDKDEEEIDRTIRIILGRCKDVCEKKKKAIGKKSLAFLVKKMFVCQSGFAPTPSLRDTFQESRMEKLMRTMLTRKIYPQNASRASSTKRYLGDNRNHQQRHTVKAEKEEESSHNNNNNINKNNKGSKWDKTDSEYIVLEI